MSFSYYCGDNGNAVLSGSKLFDPCEVSLCSHKRHWCEVQNGTAVCVCNTVCTLEYAPVCASDNKTYPNKCAMEVAACESSQRLRVVKPGKCGKCQKSMFTFFFLVWMYLSFLSVGIISLLKGILP